MKLVLLNKYSSIYTRHRALECYIEPILMYGCVAWTILKRLKKKWRQQKCGSYRGCYESNGLQKNIKKQCYENIKQQDHSYIEKRKHQATSFDHMLRRAKLDYLVTAGMIEEKRNREKICLIDLNSG